MYTVAERFYMHHYIGGTVCGKGIVPDWPFLHVIDLPDIRHKELFRTFTIDI